MLESLRTWGKNLLSSPRRDSVDDSRRDAEAAREHRATTVTRLNHEIRRLQQEISDLNDSMNAGGDPRSMEANEARMASLHQQLAAKQRELGTHQARI